MVKRIGLIGFVVCLALSVHAQSPSSNSDEVARSMRTVITNLRQFIQGLEPGQQVERDRASNDLNRAGQFLALSTKMSLKGDQVLISDLGKLLSTNRTSFEGIRFFVDTQGQTCSEVKVTVDVSVSASQTIELDFADQPLGDVIEKICEQAKLHVSFDPDGSLRLVQKHPVGMLDFPYPWLNLERFVGGVSSSPGLMLTPVGSRWVSLARGFATSTVLQAPRYEVNDDKREDFYSEMVVASPTPLPLISSIGDEYLVIGEQGRNAKGQDGYWFSLYRCKNGVLKLTNRIFQVRSGVSKDVKAPTLSQFLGSSKSTSKVKPRHIKKPSKRSQTQRSLRSKTAK